MKFKMEVDQIDLYQSKIHIPWYMGHSYTDWCTSIYYYYPIPINFIVRYGTYLFYWWWSLVKGPERFVIMGKRTFEQVQRCEYERGKIKSDEYIEERLKNLSNR